MMKTNPEATPLPNDKAGQVPPLDPSQVGAKLNDYKRYIYWHDPKPEKLWLYRQRSTGPELDVSDEDTRQLRSDRRASEEQKEKREEEEIPKIPKQ